MLERVPTPFDDRIYPVDWCAWRDPDVPDWIDPIGVLLGRNAEAAKNSKPAIVADGRPVSYAELVSLIGQYSAGLSAIGLQPEVRMLLFGTDSLDYVVTWLASVQLGAIPVVVSDLYKQRELLYFLIDTGAQVLFIDGEQLPKLIEISAELPATLKTIVVRGDVPHDFARNYPHQSVVALKTALSAGTTPGKPYIRHANDVAYMFYSGGTTGTAKGITHLAHDFVLIPERHGRFWEYTSDDVAFATSKKYFTHGLWPGVLVPLYWGATLVLDRRPPTPEVVLATLRDQRVTKLITVPTVLKNVIEHLTQTKEPAKFPALNFVVSASEKMPPEMFERFYKLTGVELFDSIGSSEITYEWIANRQKAFKRGSLGKPVFGYEVRLVDDAGRDVTEPDTPGEAWNSQQDCLLLLLAQVRKIA